MEEKNRLNAKQCSDQELKKIKGGAGTKPQGKPASNLVECVFSLFKMIITLKYDYENQ
ncbi:TPA: EntF family bacteriocin induction factor [Enterococcus faecium]